MKSLTAIMLLALSTSATANSSLVGQRYSDLSLDGKNVVMEVDRGVVKTATELTKHGVMSQLLPEQFVAAATNDAPHQDGPVTVYTGEQAIEVLGVDLPTVAQKYNMTTAAFKEMLLRDHTLKITSDHKLLVEDEIPPAQQKTQVAYELPVKTTFTGDATKLHSKPNSSKVIYLRTDCMDMTPTQWNGQQNYQCGYQFQPEELYELWSIVADSYSPFDVDITTEAPSPEKLYRTDFDDHEYGATLFLAAGNFNGICNNSCGGISYVGMYGALNSPTSQIVSLVFVSSLGFAKYAANGATHELGHLLGLLHDGRAPDNNGSPAEEYYHDKYIMGTTYESGMSIWSKGEYPRANNQQDDIATIATYVGFQADDVPNTADGAVAVVNDHDVVEQTAIKPITGLIEQDGDVDMYTFTTVGGSATFQVLQYSNSLQSGMLVPIMTIYDANMIALKTSSTFDGVLEPGKYFIAVTNTYNDYELADFDGVHGSKYSSIGQYTLEGQYTAVEKKIDPPVAVISGSSSSVQGGQTLELRGDTSTIGYGSTLQYAWSFNDDNSTSTDAVPSHTFMKAGTVKITLSVTNEANLTSTTSVDVNVTTPAANLLRISSLKLSAKYVKSANGYIATATVKVVNEKKKVVKVVQVCGHYVMDFAGINKLSDEERNIISRQICTVTRSGVAKITNPNGTNGGKKDHGSWTFTVDNITSDKMGGSFFDVQGSKLTSKTLTR